MRSQIESSLTVEPARPALAAPLGPPLSATPPSPTPPVAPLGAPPDRTAPTIVWEEIAAGGRLVVVRYKDRNYQLRETRNGKLILTK